MGFISLQECGAAYLCRLVLGRGDEVCAVLGPLQIRDERIRLVHLGVVEQLSVLCVELRDSAILVSSNDVVSQVAEACDGGLTVLAHDPQNVFVRLLGLGVRVDLVDDDGTKMAGSLLGDSEKLPAVCGELDALDGCGEVPSLQEFAGLDLP